MSTAIRKGQPRPRGALLVEVLVAIVVLGVALTLVASLLTLSTGVRRNSARRAAAREEAVNVMERLMAVPYAKLLDESVRQPLASTALLAAVPDATITIDVNELAEPLAARRITVAINWPGAESRVADSRQTLAELTSWRYEPNGASP